MRLKLMRREVAIVDRATSTMANMPAADAEGQRDAGVTD